MKKRMMKIAACLMASTMVAGNTGLVSMAAASDVPLAGLVAKVAEAQEKAESAPVTEPSKYDTVAIAQVNDDAYVNIRDAADAENGNVLGKLYNNCAADILGQEGDWYLIQSGSVTGYVNKEYFATGAEAEELAKVVGNEVATVNTETLMVREDASEEADVISMVGDSETLEVLEDAGDWVKVAIDADVVGYVAKDYVECDTQFVEAESKEEEEARIAAEEAAYLAALEEARIADEEAQRKAQEEWDAQNQAWIEYLQQQEQSQQPETQPEVSETEPVWTDDTTVDDTTVNDTTADEWQQPETQPEVSETEAVVETEASQPEETQPDQSQGGENNEANQEGNYGDLSGGASADTSGSTETSGTRQSVVNFALQFVGNPYVWGGTSLTNGADCSGFTQSVLANFGISIPRVAESQAGSGRSVALSDIQPGDLLFYSNGSGIGHVSMYIGNNQVVHASSSTTGIIVSDINYRQACSARSYID